MNEIIHKIRGHELGLLQDFFISPYLFDLDIYSISSKYSERYSKEVLRFFLLLRANHLIEITNGFGSLCKLGCPFLIRDKCYKGVSASITDREIAKCDKYWANYFGLLLNEKYKVSSLSKILLRHKKEHTTCESFLNKRKSIK